MDYKNVFKSKLTCFKPHAPTDRLWFPCFSRQSETSFHRQTMDMDLLLTASCLSIPQLFAVYSTYPRRDGQAELTCIASFIPQWFTSPQTGTFY